MLPTSHKLFMGNLSNRGARRLSGRSVDFGVRGRGFETFFRRVVSLIKTLYSQKVLVMHRKRLLRPDMTETLLTWTLNLHPNKQNNLRNIGLQFTDQTCSGCSSTLEIFCFVYCSGKKHKFSNETFANTGNTFWVKNGKTIGKVAK